jgi:molybdopterin-guanine dinucleotide biosynthesis protein A
VIFNALILAGGRSSRMGTNKALVNYQGKPLISYPITLAKSYNAGILLIDNRNDLEHYGFPVIRDIYSEGGAMAGIHSGLTASTTDWNLILTCDMPHISTGLIDKMISKLDESRPMLVPGHHGYIEPLCGFYHRKMLPVMEKHLKDGSYKLLDLIGLFPGSIVNVDDFMSLSGTDIFLNINTPSDLDQ